jgi:ABC-type spermidine/putrescine transport system permease subunit II
MLFPLVTPEIVAGVSLLILFSQLLRFVPFGTVRSCSATSRSRSAMSS